MEYFSVTISYMRNGQPHVVWRLIKARNATEADVVFNKWARTRGVGVLDYKIQDAIGEDE